MKNVSLRELSVYTQRENKDPRNRGNAPCCLEASFDTYSNSKLTEDAKIETSERALLFEVLDRLKRLEQHCGLEDTANTQDNGDDSMSISSGESAKSQDTTLATSPDSPPTHLPAVINTIVHRIKDEGSRSMLLSNVFCHLRQVESCFFENERCIRATTSAMAEIDFMQSSIPPTEPPRDPIVPKEMAKKFIESKIPSVD